MTATPALPRGVYRLRPVLGLSFFVGFAVYGYFDAYAVGHESAVTTADEGSRYFSWPGRVGYRERRLWSVLPTRWMPIPLSADGQTQCGGKLHFKASTGFGGLTLAARGLRKPGVSPPRIPGTDPVSICTHLHTHTCTYVHVSALLQAQ